MEWAGCSATLRQPKRHWLQMVPGPRVDVLSCKLRSRNCSVIASIHRKGIIVFQVLIAVESLRASDHQTNSESTALAQYDQHAQRMYCYGLAGRTRVARGRHEGPKCTAFWGGKYVSGHWTCIHECAAGAEDRPPSVHVFRPFRFWRRCTVLVPYPRLAHFACQGMQSSLGGWN